MNNQSQHTVQTFVPRVRRPFITNAHKYPQLQIAGNVAFDNRPLPNRPLTSTTGVSIQRSTVIPPQHQPHLKF